MRARIGVTLVAALASVAASLTAIQAPPPPPTPPPAAGTDTRDRYLNPRETDLSLGLEVDPREVPDIPPVEPDKALDTFRIKKGFRLELVAHEPMVVDPIQMAFDEDGRLYVVEMRWYQAETRTDLMFDERIGRIRLLEDVNGDGRFDKSSIFADKLRYPSAVIPYDGGVYVGLEPDLDLPEGSEWRRRGRLQAGRVHRLRQSARPAGQPDVHEQPDMGAGQPHSRRQGPWRDDHADGGSRRAAARPAEPGFFLRSAHVTRCGRKAAAASRGCRSTTTAASSSAPRTAPCSS